RKPQQAVGCGCVWGQRNSQRYNSCHPSGRQRPPHSPSYSGERQTTCLPRKGVLSSHSHLLLMTWDVETDHDKETGYFSHSRSSVDRRQAGKVPCPLICPWAAFQQLLKRFPLPPAVVVHPVYRQAANP